jgi:hypothetical protein
MLLAILSLYCCCYLCERHVELFTTTCLAAAATCMCFVLQWHHGFNQHAGLLGVPANSCLPCSKPHPFSNNLS